MKKYLFFAAALLCATAANAKLWRINYDDNAQADFKTIKLCLAWNGFTDGDTLYMEPGVHAGAIADNYITKSCTLLGPGWGFQTSTNNVSELVSAVITNQVVVKASNIDVKVSGIYFRNTFSVNSSYMPASLIVEHCYLDNNSSDPTNTLRGQNLVVLNNVCDGLGIGATTSCSILGNIVIGNGLGLCTPGISILCDHNTIIGNSSNYAAARGFNSKVTFSNNIVIHKTSPDKVEISNYIDPSLSVYNNVISFTTATIEAAEYTGDHTYDALRDPSCTNKIDATAANTFTCHIDDGIVDNAMYYYVKDDAVAKTADRNGGECGAFGGNYPYQLNGRPNGVPYLYDINVPTHTTNNQLSITFKVAGNNE